MKTSSVNSSHTPLLGCIADDVTGATDLATNLVQGGLRVVQILGVPDESLLAAAADFDAIVVALKTRSVEKGVAVEQSLQAVEALRSVGVSRFYFKYCSTFDSTAEGNIGPVAEAIMAALNVEQAVFCPAFPKAGRSVYRGHLFVGDRLLNESGMEDHPINPMTDANLVRVLSEQVTQSVGLLSCEGYVDGIDGISQALQQLSESNVALVIADACDDSHLSLLSDALCHMPLITGGSGLARFLPAAWRHAGLLLGAESSSSQLKVPGRAAVIAGSCSRATNVQVAHSSKLHPTWFVNVSAVMMDSNAELQRFRAWCAEQDANATLIVSSSAEPDDVEAVQLRFSVESVARAVETFLALAAEVLAEEFSVRRLIVAGGETSGAVVSQLGVRMLRIGPEICTGVPWTETVGASTELALALKSGNFGEHDFFETALEMLV